MSLLVVLIIIFMIIMKIIIFSIKTVNSKIMLIFLIDKNNWILNYYNGNEGKFALKVLGQSVGLCKTTKRKGKLVISLLVDVWRIICENFNPIWLILAEIWMKI